jgi:hypothetical protein
VNDTDAKLLSDVTREAYIHVSLELSDDPTQYDEGCALWPLIQALEALGYVFDVSKD